MYDEEDVFIDNFNQLEKLKRKGVKIASKAVDELEVLLGSKNESVRLMAAQEVIRLACYNSRKNLG
jgi:hypothetical protein